MNFFLECIINSLYQVKINIKAKTKNLVYNTFIKQHNNVLFYLTLDREDGGGTDPRRIWATTMLVRWRYKIDRK